MSIEFWLRFEPQISPTRLAIIFFIDHCQGRKEGSFVCEIVCFFSWVNSHPFYLKFVAFCPEFSGDSYMKFQKKTISGEFFRNFCANEGYPLHQFCSLSVWDLPGLTPRVFWSEIFTRRSSLCLLSFGRDLSSRFVPQDWK